MHARDPEYLSTSQAAREAEYERGDREYERMVERDLERPMPQSTVAEDP